MEDRLLSEDSEMNNDITEELTVVDDAEPYKQEEQKYSNEFKLAVSFTCMVFVGLGNKLFQVFQTLPMHNYPNALNVVSTFIYIPICFGYVWIFPGHVSEEARHVSKRVFAVMGAYDAIGGALVTFSVNYITKRTLIVLLQQSAIPISMIISKLLLKTKYNLYQYLGAFVVILGLVVVLLPSFGVQDQGKVSGSELFWMVLLVASNVPVCLSSVYKEKVLGDIDVNVIYLNGWVAFFQFLLCIPLLIPGSLSSNVPLQKIPVHLWDGLKCISGIDSVKNLTKACFPVDSGLSPCCDDCANAPYFVSSYLVFNIGYNILMIMILKYGDSNILWLSMTFMVPLVNFVFYLPSIPGHQDPKASDLIGLAIIFIGLLLYRFSALVSHAMKRVFRKSKAGYFRLFDSPRTPRTQKREEEAQRIAQQRMASHITVAGNVQPAETVQTAIEFTISEVKVKLRRTPVQIRNSYLQRVGVNSSTRQARAARSNSGG